jgi:hypothetical protein
MSAIDCGFRSANSVDPCLNVCKVFRVLGCCGVFAAQVSTAQFADGNLECFGSRFDVMLVLEMLEELHQFRVELHNNLGFHD